MDRSDGRSSGFSSLDDPPNSRLFIIGSKSLSENDYREAFGLYGTIEEIWTVKDKHTGENKGIAYIKFEKTSEAAQAMEAMNGKRIRNSTRNLKIMISASRGQVPKRELNEEEKILRLFVVVPKTMNDSELYEYFKQYGEIDYATVLRDKETRESKGFAYVKYYKFSHAALAYEHCDRKYKPVFAEPRKPSSYRSNDNDNNNTRNNHHHLSLSWDSKLNSPNYNPILEPYGTPPPPSNSYPNNSHHANSLHGNATVSLTAIVSPMVNQDQLWRLFDIVPGLDYCQLNGSNNGNNKDMGRSTATVVYNSAHWANYAKEKLHGLEYPPGCRIIVKFDGDVGQFGGGGGGERSEGKGGGVDVMQIAEKIAFAAGITPAELQARLGMASTSKQSDLRCSVHLPDPMPMVEVDDAAARCFVVCSPGSLSQPVLRDVFCRFGDLIDVYMLTNKNCGFAKYASKASADSAMRVLHGAVVNGVRLKVLEAEERQQDQNKRKRQRLEDN